MATSEDLMAKNAVDALDVSQRYLLLGMASAALLALVTLDTPRLMATRERVDIPSVGKLDLDLATLLLWLGYIGFGVLANSALSRAKECAAGLADTELGVACLSHFTLLTSSSRFIRLTSTLLPALLFIACYVIEAQRHPRLFDLQRVGYLVIGFLVLLAPYLRLATSVYDRPLVHRARTTSPPVEDDA
jgi:Trk-type K+ transport system membrane component